MAADEEQYRLSSEGYDPIQAWKRSAATEQGRQFPQTRVLSASEGVEVRKTILASLGFCGDATNRSVLDALYTETRPLPGFDDLGDGNVNVAGMLDGAEILSDTVLVLLPLEGAFDSGFRMNRSDLIGFFDDIWYPSTDDLVVIDEQRKTVLLVDHHGRVSTIHLGRDSPERKKGTT